jgi:hypothetical protein
MNILNDEVLLIEKNLKNLGQVELIKIYHLMIKALCA